MDQLLLNHLRGHQAMIDALPSLLPRMAQAARMAADSLARGGKLLLCGNGGSAADCQHIAAELVGRLARERRALPALALTTDTSALTAIANDYGYDQVFRRQLQALARGGDCLIAISTSGQSANVVAAVHEARHLGLRSIGLLGRDGGVLAGLCDCPIVVPSDITAHVQEAHILLGHVLCAGIERMALAPQCLPEGLQ